MKTIPEVLAIIDVKLTHHKKEIEKVIEQLSSLKVKTTLTNEMKSELVRYAMLIGEHKGIINALSSLSKEIQQ